MRPEMENHELVFAEDEEERVDEEPFRRDRGGHYTGHIETRVLLDPTWFHFGDPFSAFTELQQLIEYARIVTTPVKIELVYPDYLRAKSSRRWPGAFFHRGEMREIGPPKDEEPELPAKVETVVAPIGRDYEQLKAPLLEYKSRGETPSDAEIHRAAHGSVLFENPRGLDLFVLYHEHRCDYMLSENPWLLDLSEALRKELGAWVVRATELIC
jgi:hypothetical protein